MITFIIEAFILAVAIDLLFGEPKPAYHPVVWIGSLIGFLKERPPKRFKVFYGLIIALLTIGLTVGVGYGITVLLYSISPLIALLVTAYLLKSTFCFSFLWGISADIFNDLRSGKLEEARSKLPALVGRDVSKLNESQMSSCVIESLGESFVDGIFSPLFYFVIFGLPGALAYRAINTLDSMVGYKDEKHRQIGFVSAKVDDMANYIPARLAVVLMAIVALPYGGMIRAIKIALRDGRKTPSINSGFPMSAYAGALGLRLEKLNYYVLGEGLKPCDVSDVPKAISYNKAAGVVIIILAIIILYFTGLPLITY
jgi:adenosylcobinamide-phosphate synthase